MLTPLTQIMSVAIALIGGWLIPWAAMTFIMRARFKSGKQQAANYAGKPVSYGLGIVWLVWAAVLFGSMLKADWLRNLLAADPFRFGTYPDALVAHAFLGAMQRISFDNTFFVLAIPLVISCFFFGWLDDRFGKKGSGGFKGHLKSLFKGKLTTGMIKVLGIGFTALAVSIAANGFGLVNDTFSRITFFDVLWILVGTCAIALSANLINLFDLRPARASKAYIGLLLQVFFIAVCSTLVIAAVTGLSLNAGEIVGRDLIVVLWALGPIFAIWRFDAGERAMLGDAGANAAGALLGLYAVMNLWILLPIYAIIVFALNMLSERYSFSTIIESVPVLQRIDQWGRP